MSGAAAAATLLGLVGGVLLRGGIRGPMPHAANAPVELQQEAAGEDEGSSILRLPSLSVPRLAIVDTETPLADEAAVRAHLGGLGEAKALLGTPLDRVPELADAARQTITAAPLLRSGTAPNACLDAVEQAGLVAHVESVTYQGQPALAYVVASASDGASRLDQIHVILVDPRTCAERLFI